MGITKKLLALVLAALMLVSACIVVSAALPTTPTSSFSGVKHYKYWSAGAESGKETTYQILKFNVNDGVMPLAYSGDVGKTGSVVDHVAAAQAEGYEVLGAINGSFFNMTTGDPCPALISGGRLMFATATREEVFTTFDSNGKPNLIQTTLNYALTLDGSSVSNGIGLINKDYTAIGDIKNIDISNRFHYYDNAAGALNKSTDVTGYEILCEKINGTDLKVTETLEGKVISVTSGYYAKTIPTNPNQFVLFVKTSSSFKSKATALSAGDLVSLRVYSSDSWANQILGNTYSAICDTYWLVKDGVNIAATTAEIGHKTSGYHRPWTAFGWDDNGNYCYIITEGEKASLRDVALEMISAGCTNVVRLDGGGSTAMWVNGSSTYAQGRLVTDSLLIVKRPASLEFESVLLNASSYYAGDYSKAADDKFITAYEKAAAVHANPYATGTQIKTAMNELNAAITALKNDNQTKFKDFLYVEAFNQRVPSGGAVIINSNYCNGVLTYNDTGLSYSYGMRCKLISEGKYKVVEKYEKSRDTINLASNEILIILHNSTNTTKYPYCALNYANYNRIAVGETITLNGIDVENETISGCAYISAQFTANNDSTDPTPDPKPNPDPDPKPSEYSIGDVNKSGAIDMMDYVLLKRNYFGTFEFDGEQVTLGDVNKSGAIDMMDYVLLKRAYFGTYKF